MGRNLKAARVGRMAQEFLQPFVSAGVKIGNRSTPTWLAAIELISPSEILTRPYPLQHTAPDPRRKKPSRNLYKPTQIVYPEDRLRQRFYRDHPWELARPRMMLELDGKDARGRNWSTGLRQPGMLLSGESVVQRQLWLIECGGFGEDQAYDMARKEFYKLRHREDVERRIAVEEARMMGAYFGKTVNQIGQELEDVTFERWKAWAANEIAKIDSENASAYSVFGNDETKDAAVNDVETADRVE